MDGVFTGERCHELHGVVAVTQVDAVAATDRRIDVVAARTQAHHIVGCTQGHRIHTIRAHDGHVAGGLSRRIQSQTLTVVRIDRRITTQHRAAAREQSVGDGQQHVVTTDDHVLQIKRIVQLVGAVDRRVGVGQHIGARLTEDGVIDVELIVKDDGVVAGTQLHIVIATHRGEDQVISAIGVNAVTSKTANDGVHTIFKAQNSHGLIQA